MTNKAILAIIILSALPLCHAATLITYGDFQLSTDFPDLLTNGDFSDGLNDWEVQNEGLPGNSITEVAGECVMVRSNVGPPIIFQAPVPNVDTDDVVEFKMELVAVTTSDHVNVVIGSPPYNFTTTGNHTGIVTASNQSHSTPKLAFTPAPNPADVTIDNIFLRHASPWRYSEDWDLFTDGKATYTSSSNNSQELMKQSFTSIEDRLYMVDFTIAGLSFTNDAAWIRIGVGGGNTSRAYTSGVYQVAVIAGANTTQGVQFRPTNDVAGDTFELSDVSVERIRESGSSETILVIGTISVGTGANEDTGPTGSYTQTSSTNDGQPVWASDVVHPNGNGGTDIWFLWFNEPTSQWIIGTVVDREPIGEWDWVVTPLIVDNPSNQEYEPFDASSGTAFTRNGPATGTADRLRGRLAGEPRSRY